MRVSRAVILFVHSSLGAFLDFYTCSTCLSCVPCPTVMLTTTLILAAGSLTALSNAAPVQHGTSSPTVLAARAAYITFGGDGSMSAGWPTQDEWISFKEAW